MRMAAAAARAGPARCRGRPRTASTYACAIETPVVSSMSRGMRSPGIRALISTTRGPLGPRRISRWLGPQVNPTVRTIDEHRAQQREARTLSGLTTEIGHLRTAVEAIAATVKHHEEQVRRLNRQTT